MSYGKTAQQNGIIFEQEVAKCINIAYKQHMFYKSVQIHPDLAEIEYLDNDWTCELLSSKKVESIIGPSKKSTSKADLLFKSIDNKWKVPISVKMTYTGTQLQIIDAKIFFRVL